MLIGLSGCYFQPLAWLPSVVCCVSFAYLYVHVHVHVHGVHGCISIMNTPHVCALFNWFLFFLPLFAPKTPPPEEHLWASPYTEGIKKWELKGALHAILVHILWVEDNPRTIVLVMCM